MKAPVLVYPPPLEKDAAVGGRSGGIHTEGDYRTGDQPTGMGESGKRRTANRESIGRRTGIGSGERVAEPEDAKGKRRNRDAD
ncbi:MAG: hypothetical protein BWY44_00933 [Candidatus Omnitrophica bacterium ADurb.Bin292]|nr:MAG: hypothetical protein BWY44_00933 [Candidatus Omnitrophica bacterium ADurb.Bin292]